MHRGKSRQLITNKARGKLEISSLHGSTIKPSQLLSSKTRLGNQTLASCGATYGNLPYIYTDIITNVAPVTNCIDSWKLKK